MANKTYADKLRDPRWQKLRLEILNRDKWKCQHCDDKETELQVHHIYYSGDPWEADPTSLITLCKHCHKIEETFKKLEVIVCKVFKDKMPETIICGVAVLVKDAWATIFFEFRANSNEPDQPYFIPAKQIQQLSDYIKENTSNGN